MTFNPDQFYANITKQIAQSGMQIMGVMDSPPFSYSIGLAEKYGLELICMGLNPIRAQTLFNTIRLEVLVPGQFKLDVEFNDLANLPLMFRECLPGSTDEYVVQHGEYYKGIPPDLRPKSVRWVQVVLPDQNGRFPEDPAYNHKYMDRLQKLLYKP